MAEHRAERRCTGQRIRQVKSKVHGRVKSRQGRVNVTEYIIKSSVADPDPGSGIRDWVLFDLWIRDPGWVKIRIRDPG